MMKIGSTGKRAVLRGMILLLLLVGMGAVQVRAPRTASAADVPPPDTPLPPPGWTSPTASQDLSQLYGIDPSVQLEITTMSADECATFQQAYPGAGCQIFDHSTVAMSQPLPQGTQNASTVWW
jgi:hypothetical protein